MTKRIDADGAVSRWDYDSAANGVGKLAKEISSNGFEQMYTYDSLSRLEITDTRIHGGSRKFTFSYDGFGRIDTTRYPSGCGGRARFRCRSQ